MKMALRSQWSYFEIRSHQADNSIQMQSKSSISTSSWWLYSCNEVQLDATTNSRLQETRKEKKARYSDTQSWGLMSGKLSKKWLMNNEGTELLSWQRREDHTGNLNNTCVSGVRGLDSGGVGGEGCNSSLIYRYRVSLALISWPLSLIIKPHQPPLFIIVQTTSGKTELLYEISLAGPGDCNKEE